MVRLVITDFTSKEQNEAFYLTDEFAATQNMFTYSSFKKYSVYLSPFSAFYHYYDVIKFTRVFVMNLFYIFIIIPSHLFKFI